MRVLLVLSVRLKVCSVKTILIKIKTRPQWHVLLNSFPIQGLRGAGASLSFPFCGAEGKKAARKLYKLVRCLELQKLHKRQRKNKHRTIRPYVPPGGGKNKLI